MTIRLNKYVPIELLAFVNCLSRAMREGMFNTLTNIRSRKKTIENKKGVSKDNTGMLNCYTAVCKDLTKCGWTV